jgi:hypothetical protein
MTDGGREPQLKGDAPVAKTHAEREGDGEFDSFNPIAFWGGLFCVVLLLCVASWFILDRLRCDPYYATISRLQRSTCQ